MGNVCDMCATNPGPVVKERPTRMIILGAGESGKSTFMKQMELLNDENEDHTFPTERKEAARSHVFQNLLEGVSVLGNFGRENEFRLTDPDSIEAFRTINTFFATNLELGSEGNREPIKNLTEEQGNALKTLAKDETFVYSLSAASHLCIPDGFSYFLKKVKNFPEWGGRTWIPSDEDVLNVRNRTVGTNRIKLSYQGNKFEFLDVGGQVVERKNWMKLFSGINGVAWLQSLGDYDQMMFENENEYRIVDAFELFEKTINNETFSRSVIMVLLNKIDILERKFCKQRIPINPSFGNDQFPVPVYNPEFTNEQNLGNVKIWFTNMLGARFKWKRELIVFSMNALSRDTVQHIAERFFVQRFNELFFDAGFVSGF